MSGGASKTSASSHSDDRSASLCNLGGQDTSRDQAVLSEVIDDAIERAFQENVALVHEDPLNCPCRAGGQEGQRRLGIIVITWRGGETRQHNLARSRKGDGECTVSLDVLIGAVPGCADESEVVLPAQRRGHVFRHRSNTPLSSREPMMTSGATMKNRSQIGRFRSRETRGKRFSSLSNGIILNDSFGWVDIALAPSRSGSRTLGQVDHGASLC